MKASTEAYLKIVALVFPMSYWNKVTEPESKAMRDCMHDLIHCEKVDKLDQYMTIEDKTAISAIFNASSKLVDQEMQEWSGNRVKKADWARTWAQVQKDIQTAYLPQSGAAPTFVAALIFEDANGVVEAKKRRERERQGVEDGHQLADRDINAASAQ